MWVNFTRLEVKFDEVLDNKISDFVTESNMVNDDNIIENVMSEDSILSNSDNKTWVGIEISGEVEVIADECESIKWGYVWVRDKGNFLY